MGALISTFAPCYQRTPFIFRKKWLLQVLLCAVIGAFANFAGALPIMAQSTEVWVNDDWTSSEPGEAVDGHVFGTDAFARIQDGIDEVAPSGTVHVAAGIYYENIMLKEGVRVIGDGAARTTIDGNGNGSVVTAENIAEEIEISGFTIRNGENAHAGGGIRIISSAALVNGNVITNNRGGAGGGIYIRLEELQASPRIENNVIINNSAGSYGGGGVALYYASATVRNNTISGNTADAGSYGGGGIFAGYTSSLTVVNNIIYDNSTGQNSSGGGILVTDGSVAEIIYNDVFNNTPGNYSGCTPGEGNISADPMFVDPLGGDYHLWTGSPCIDSGTAVGAPVTDFEGTSRPVDGNGDGVPDVDMGADETGSLLGRDVASQAVLSPDSQIPVDLPVAPAVRIRNIGTVYQSSINVTCQIKQEDIVIYSDFQTVTDLSMLESADVVFTGWTPTVAGAYSVNFSATLPEGEDDENPDNNIRVKTIEVRTYKVFVEAENMGGTEDGSQENPFNSIQEGIDAAISGEDTVIVGAGFYSENITLKKGVIVKGAGPGVSIIDGGGNGPVVSVGDPYGEAIGPDTVLEGFTVQNGSNDYYGAGIDITNASPIIRSNTITNNQGWGIYAPVRSTPQIKFNIISNNSSGVKSAQAVLEGNAIYSNDGDGIEARSGCRIINNIVSRNGGDGITLSFSYGDNVDTDIIANTIAGNSGAGLRSNRSPFLNLKNNIMADNGDYGIFFSADYDWGDPDSSHNDLWANLPENYGGLAAAGIGDISADPVFVDPAGGDYHLWAGSPCIDAGTGDGAPDRDFDGELRPVDGNGDGIPNADMGADETLLLLEHDASAQIMLLPNQEEPLGVLLVPKVRVRNIGTGDEGEFTVTCRIESGDVEQYLNSKTVSALSSLEASDIIFPEWQPPDTGDYVISFICQLPGDENAGNDSLIKTFHVKASPDTAFTADVTNGALPLAVQFTDLSRGEVSQWHWDFGDGDTSGQQHPVHTYLNEGIYSVSLTASNSDGSETETKAGYISAVRVPANWILPEKLVGWVGTPDMGVSDAGRVCVVWENEGNPYIPYGIYFVEKEFGGDWTPPGLVSQGSVIGTGPQVVYDGEEGLHVVWQDYINGKNVIQYVSKPSGGAWSSPIELAEGSHSALAAGPDDTIHAVWTTGTDIVYARKPKNGQWTEAVYISGPEAEYSQEPAIAVGLAGKVGAVWTKIGIDDKIMYAEMTSEEAWSEPELVTTGYGLPALTISQDGTVHVVWGRGGVFHSTRRPDGVWMTPEVISQSGFDRSPETVVDPSGDTTHVLWIGNNYDIYRAHSCKGSMWFVEDLFPASTGTYSRITTALGSDGRLHMAWYRNDLDHFGIWYSEYTPPIDSDGDCLFDDIELKLGTDIHDIDSDDDGISDSEEDANHSGTVDAGETDPAKMDTDGDLVQDGTELGYTLPIPDPDDARILAATDVNVFIPDLDPTTTTDPLNADSDGDGVTDGLEDLNRNGRFDPGETDPNWKPLDIFAMELGNTWIYTGTRNGLPLVVERNVTAVDDYTFPVSTYVMTIKENNVVVGMEHYQNTGTMLKLWGVDFEEGGIWIQVRFSEGLPVAWYPMAVNDSQTVSTTAIILGIPDVTYNVSLESRVVGTESLAFGFDTVETFRMTNRLRLWGNDIDETDSFTWWSAPYLGVVQETDATSSVSLSSFAIGMGLITQQSDADEDDITDYMEIFKTGTHWRSEDTDSDGCEDGFEVQYGLDPLDFDSDNDAMPDGWEVNNGLNPLVNDADADLDGDRFTNLEEYLKDTNPNDRKSHPSRPIPWLMLLLDDDSDSDGMNDDWEKANSLNPLLNDANDDTDSDGLSNLQEYQSNTDPQKPDTDDDGMPDGWEIENSLNPLVDDGNQDADVDLLTNLQEYENYTNPQNPDTEGDGMADDWEVDYGLDPLSDDSFRDLDKDRYTNYDEFLMGSDPTDRNDPRSRAMPWILLLLE